MQTRKLTKAFPLVDRLAHYLTGREWESAPELTAILSKADRKIKEIEQRAISDVIARLKGSYSEEARLWAENKRTDMSGNHVKATRVEQRKAAMELKRIERTIAKLRELLDGSH
jgi:hypothetical protein